MHGARAMLFFLAGCVLGGCGSGADVSGTVGGQAFTAGSVWWGGPYIIMTEEKYDCIDMDFVSSSYDDAHPPGADAKRFLQFMFNSGGEVSTGVFTIAETTESPVSSSFWDYTGSTLTQYHGRIGSLQITDVTSSKKISGKFDVSFDKGELAGTFDKVDWCTNIKSDVAN